MRVHIAPLNSVAGVVCNGTGSWIFASASPGAHGRSPLLSLAEVQVCSADELSNELYLSNVTQRIDISAGLLELDSSGAITMQVAPQLLPFSSAGRNARWRDETQHAARPWTQFLSVITPMATAVALGTVAILALGLTIAYRHAILGRFGGHGSRPKWTSGRRSGYALTAGGDGPVSSEPASEPTLMNVTFETADGSIVRSSVDMEHMTHAGDIITAVKRAGADALGKKVDHISVQYVNVYTSQTEQVEFDPILGESSDVDVAKLAPEWRVLVWGLGA